MFPIEREDIVDDGTTNEPAVVDSDASPELPPLLLGRSTAAVERQVAGFYASAAAIFER